MARKNKQPNSLITEKMGEYGFGVSDNISKEEKMSECQTKAGNQLLKSVVNSGENV